MKPDIRWQLLLAVACVGLILSIIGFQYQTEGICTVLIPATGGRLVEGMVGQPHSLSPLFSDTNKIDKQLVDLIFDGLTRYNEDGELVAALAENWSVSGDRQTVTFQLRDDLYWHDGQPVTAADVGFTYNLLKDGDLPISANLRALWEGVEIQTRGSNQIIFDLPEPYGPFMDATTRSILPAHILQNVDSVDLVDHRFNQFPIGTGPFLVQSGSDWRRTGIFRLEPNPNYWREGSMLRGIDIRFYSDFDQVIEAFRQGEIQAISGFEVDILKLTDLPGIEIFTFPATTYHQLIFNLSETGTAAVQNKAVRQALAKGLDKNSLINDAAVGQGLPMDGPYLPSNWAHIPGDLADSFDIDAASTGLDSEGWTLGDSSQVRTKEGIPLEIRLIFQEEVMSQALANEIARQWAEIGVATILLPKSADDFQISLSSREFDAAILTVEPPGDPDLYDFWSQEAIVRGQNYSGWNNRWASEALESARQLFDREERKALYDAFLGYFNDEVPAITLFQDVSTYGISEAIENVDIGQINSPRERFESMAQWFFYYREVSVACDDEEG